MLDTAFSIAASIGAIVVLFARLSKINTTDTAPENPDTTSEAWQNAPVTTRSTIAPHDELDSRSLGDTTSRPLSATVTNEGPSFEAEPELDVLPSNEGDSEHCELPAEPPIDTGESTRGDTSSNFSDLSYDWVWETGVRMADVGGMDEVKTELHRDVIKPMKEEPEKAEKFNIPLPNLLLYGPPGTGKTYLAKALATALGFPLVTLSGSDVTSKWINESSQKVRTLFDEAESLAEETGGAVIFLDELDAVLPERSGKSHEENRKVVNEFLSHLQESSRKRVLFVGATNKHEDLDNAATRNGRIDKEIHIGQSDIEARREILEAQLADRPHMLDEDDIEDLAAVTDDMVAADIEAMVNQAARSAAYGRDGDHIKREDFDLEQ